MAVLAVVVAVTVGKTVEGVAAAVAAAVDVAAQAAQSARLPVVPVSVMSAVAVAPGDEALAVDVPV
jgi:hypothetical protein